MKLSRKQSILIGVFLLVYVAIKAASYFLNPTEVGDSYRYLKAGLSLTLLTYPLDEKRLPFFPLFLSLGVKFMDPIWWGRIVATVFCLGSLILTFKISLKLFNNFKVAFFTLVLTAISPIFFYGTARVLAEGQFAFFLLLFLYFFFLKKSYILLGVVAGLCFLTRYEGILLVSAFGLDALLSKKFRNLAFIILGFGLIASPFVIRNILIFSDPLKSNYLIEPSGFSYNFKSVLIVVSAFLFCFGNFLVSPLLMFRSIKEYFVRYRPVFIYFVLSLLLFFFWIAAMPRLFVYLVPVFAIFTVPIFLNILSKPLLKSPLFLLSVVLNASLFVFFRTEYRYHFLVLGKWFLIIYLFFSLGSILLLVMRKLNLCLIFITISILISSLAYTMHYRNLYQTIYKAVLFSRDLKGKIAYSDETGITSWYLVGHNTLYFDDTDGAESVDYLRSQGVKYAIVTNEFDEYRRLIFLEKKDNKNDVLLIKKFQANDGGYIRYSKVFEIIY